MQNISLITPDILRYTSDEYYFCNYRVLAAVASNFGKHHELIFANLWNFDYSNKLSNEINCIGNKMIINDNDLFSLIKLYYNIAVEIIETNPYKKISKIILNELLSKRLVATKINYSKMSWANEYGSTNDIYSIVLITGLRNNNEIEFIDIHLKGEVRYLSSIEFINNCKDLCLFKMLDKTDNIPNELDIINSIIANCNKSNFGYKNQFDALHNLAYDIETNFKLENEFDYNNNIPYVPIHINLLKLVRSRFNTSRLLNHLKYYDINIPDRIINNLFISSTKWNNIRVLVQKIYFRGVLINNENTKIANLIKDIIMLEIEIYSELIKYKNILSESNNSNYKKTNNITNNHSIKCKFQNLEPLIIQDWIDIYGNGVWKNINEKAEIVFSLSDILLNFNVLGNICRDGDLPIETTNLQFELSHDGVNWMVYEELEINDEDTCGNPNIWGRTYYSKYIPQNIFYLKIKFPYNTYNIQLPTMHKLMINNIVINYQQIIFIENKDWIKII